MGHNRQLDLDSCEKIAVCIVSCEKSCSRTSTSFTMEAEFDIIIFCCLCGRADDSSSLLAASSSKAR